MTTPNYSAEPFPLPNPSETPNSCDFDKVTLPLPPRDSRINPLAPVLSLPLRACCKECNRPLGKRFIVDDGVVYCPECDEAGRPE